MDFEPRTDTHESLLTEWRNRPHHQGKSFFEDGIIDPLRWTNAKRKLLFLQKEAHDSNSPGSEGFDLRKIIGTEWDGKPQGGTYGVVATWAYALSCASAHMDEAYPRWDLIDTQKQREALLSSAVMNIKKSDGRTGSSDTDLEGYIEADGDLIKRQIDLIDPDIVVCGHVWHMIAHLWQNAQKVYDDVFEADGRTFIAYWHPANRSPGQMNYYALAALVQNSGALNRYRPG